LDMSDRIKQLRLQHGMTQEELGRLLGVKKSAIQKYESGMVKNIKRPAIKKMADTFGVKPSYLMGFDDAPITASEKRLAEKYLLLKNSDNPKDRAVAAAIDMLLSIAE